MKHHHKNVQRNTLFHLNVKVIQFLWRKNWEKRKNLSRKSKQKILFASKTTQPFFSHSKHRRIAELARHAGETPNFRLRQSKSTKWPPILTIPQLDLNIWRSNQNSESQQTWVFVCFFSFVYLLVDMCMYIYYYQRKFRWDTSELGSFKMKENNCLEKRCQERIDAKKEKMPREKRFQERIDAKRE